MITNRCCHVVMGTGEEVIVHIEVDNNMGEEECDEESRVIVCTVMRGR